MRTIFSPDHALHHPEQEIADGMLKPAVEIPVRANMVRDRVEAVGLGPIEPPRAFERSHLERVHTADYLDFLEGFWAKWLAAERVHEAFPFAWPVRGLRSDVVPRHIDGLLGHYSFDAGSPLTAGTWAAARTGVDVALTAAGIVNSGERSAFALCRPPGHHAAADYFGGYCFLNNAAIAAAYLRDQGAPRVAILDVDYHHGNGTQSIFYDRDDVFFCSIHADPADEYPYFLGYADETGTGAGEGHNLNLPLALGTAWPAYAEALGTARKAIDAFGADALVVSLGLDTFEKDPISGFALKNQDFLRMGEALAGFDLPTVFIMEGGYAVEDLGINCVNVLTGFEQA
ncbi:MAG: acetylpolyamine amidohydrolase [Hyphomicrobiales bacterium]|nr:MAG: acetylpolyamine amidohydrolase [Hyphomicrobiales bacterium]